MEQDYNSWHKGQSLEDFTASWHQFAFNKMKVMDLTDFSILEIGCGRGGFTLEIYNRFPEVKKIVASDFSNEALSILKSRMTGFQSSKIVVKNEDIQKLSFSENSFDLVISMETIEHVAESKKAIQELFRVLRPGGYLILTCPNYFNFFGIWCIYRKLIGKPFTEGQPFVNYILYPRLLFWIKKSGFSLINSETLDLIIPFRRPRTYFRLGLPKWLKFLGHRTFFLLCKSK